MSDWIQKNDSPFVTFTNWYKQAQGVNSLDPTAMTLATVDNSGMPSARVVLLKQHDEAGLCFFTNYDSVKADELRESPKACLVFHWEKPLHRQIRIKGLVEKMSVEESNAYFQTRDRGSQIGAWSSPQSKEISSRDELVRKVKANEDKFQEGEIPCPENLGGYRLKPLSFEFWQAEDFRLHNRIKFNREDLKTSWVARYLAP